MGAGAVFMNGGVIGTCCYTILVFRCEEQSGHVVMQRVLHYMHQCKLQKKKVCIFLNNVLFSLVPRPHPSAREKGLVTIARFLVCTESAVLNSRKPIRLQVLDLSCDKHAIA